MNNIRHISIFNEFRLRSVLSGGNYSFVINKNVSVVELLSNKKYKIKNLSIDIGSNILNILDVFFGDTRKFGFPFRFYLDENPLGNEYLRLVNLYPSSQIKLNNTIVTSQELGFPIALDIVDSSNVYFDGNKYYNSFEFTQIQANPEILLQLGKTQTVAEYNFYNYFYGRISETPTKIINSNSSNNDISDFYFDSKTFNYLCFSIFPFLSFFIWASPYELSINFNFTINFDLEEI